MFLVILYFVFSMFPFRIMCAHYALTVCDKVLGNVGKRLKRFVSWRVALPAYDVSEVIASS